VMIVYVSTDPDRYDEVLEGLESAKGRIRSLVGKAITWRVTPEIRFFIDRSVDSGERITQALKDVPPSLAYEREHPELAENVDDETGSSSDDDTLPVEEA